MSIKRFVSGDILAFPINEKEYGFLYYILGNSLDYRLIKVFNSKMDSLENLDVNEILKSKNLYACPYILSVIDGDNLIKVGNVPFDFEKHKGKKVYLRESLINDEMNSIISKYERNINSLHVKLYKINVIGKQLLTL